MQLNEFMTKHNITGWDEDEPRTNGDGNLVYTSSDDVVVYGYAFEGGGRVEAWMVQVTVNPRTLEVLDHVIADQGYDY